MPGSRTVTHFSEDPGIERFVPHVAATASDQTPYVWAVDEQREPDYWFPRQCPRAMAWVEPGTTDDDRRALLGPGARRVHVIEYGWLTSMQQTRLFAYRFDARDFRPYSSGPSSHAFVADHSVVPLGPPDQVPDVLALHEQAGIQLRLVHSIWPWWRAVTESTLGFSGIRLRNAAP
jgi:hypothetical protein